MKLGRRALLATLPAASLALACVNLPFGLGGETSAEATASALEEEESMQPAPDRQVGLPGTRWLVLSYLDGEGRPTTPLEGTLLSVEFSSELKLNGSAGCNRYFAGYSIEDQAFQIGPVGSTRMFCGEPEGVMDQETAFLAALAQVRSFEQQAERLALRNEAGETQLQLVSAVTGSFSYRIRKAIPPDTRLRVQLEEVGSPQASPRLIAEHSFLAEGKQLAFEFTVVFDPALIAPSLVYQLRADMLDRKRKLIMTTTAASPVITQDHPSFQVELTLDATADGPG